MNKVKIAFFGAPAFAAQVLQNILDDKNIPVTVSFVVTQPDRPAGRKQILTPTPVKILAQKNALPVFDDLKLEAVHSKLQEVDLVLLYAFGEFLPKKLLDLPTQGFWNIHPSLLPKYRNTSPIAYALLLGELETGVSLIQMDEKLDHGPILDQEVYSIQDSDTRADLENRLSDIGYKLFKKNVQLLIDGSIHKREQDHEKRTYSRLLTKKDGFISLPIVQKIIKGELLISSDLPPIISEYCEKYSVPMSYDSMKKIYFNMYRALSPWPGLWTYLPGEKRLKITHMEYKEGRLTITHVQLEGKKEVPLNTFLSAYSLS
jgi:methionyl-tRNA formyltransferase